MVPSTDASKPNASEAAFALMLCQCDSCNTDVIGVQRNGKEFMGTRIAHFELLHMFSLHKGVWHRLMRRRHWSMGLVWQPV